MKKLLLLTCMLIMYVISTNTYSSLLGNEMTATWSTNTGYIDVNTFVVTENVELINDWGFGNYLDTGPSSISVVIGFNGGINAGVSWLFSDMDFSDSDNGIINVVVNTNYLGWSDSFVTFGADYVEIDFLNEVTFLFEPNHFEIELITDASPVPLPSALLLFISGLITLAWRKNA